MVLRAEKDQSALKVLSQKIPQFNQMVTTYFVKSGSWNPQNVCFQQKPNLGQIADELRRAIIAQSYIAIMSRDLKLHPAFLTMRMGRNETELVDKAVLSHLGELNPLLKHIITVKLVCNQRRNLINIRVRRELLATIHHYSDAQGLHVFFTMSDALQPYVRILPIDESAGELSLRRQFTPPVWAAIARGAAQLKGRFQITQERYRCSLDAAARDFAALDELTAAASSAERVAALEMRVATRMARDKLPILEHLLPSPDSARALLARAAAGDRRGMATVERFVPNIVERRDPVRLKAREGDSAAEGRGHGAVLLRARGGGGVAERAVGGERGGGSRGGWKRWGGGGGGGVA